MKKQGGWQQCCSAAVLLPRVELGRGKAWNHSLSFPFPNTTPSKKTRSMALTAGCWTLEEGERERESNARATLSSSSSSTPSKRAAHHVAGSGEQKQVVLFFSPPSPPPKKNSNGYATAGFVVKGMR